MLLTACTTIDAHTPPPVGWPQLRVEIVDDERADKGIEKYCGTSTPFKWYMGCAVPDFAQGICFIYVRDRHKALIEHETMHCAGYDHHGGTSIMRVMDYWKAQGWTPK